MSSASFFDRVSPPAFRYKNPDTDLIIFGEEAAPVVAGQVHRLEKQRVVILTSASLRNSQLVRSVEIALGERHAATYGEITANAPRDRILAAAALVREAHSDVLVAIGGGSVIDAAKLVQLCVWEGLISNEAIAQYDPARLSGVAAAKGAIRTIAVPTTLSGAEFATLGGSYNPANGRKEPFDHPLFIPKVIVEDANALAQTPAEMVLTTGVRMVDHCVERFCSTAAQPYSDAQALGALKLLLQHLPAVRNGLATTADHGRLQLASWMSMDAVNAGVTVGASHAIGRVLGVVSGVSHGHTSAILLPAVLAWNARDLQAQARHQELIRALKVPGDLQTFVGDFIEELGQPRKLSNIGVKRGDLSRIATDSMTMLQHPSVSGNLRPVTSENDVLEILELAW